MWWSSSSRRRCGTSTRLTTRISSCGLLRASSPVADVVAVTEAPEEITADDEAEDVGTVEKAAEGASGCPETTRLSNGRISQRRKRRRSDRLGRKRRTGRGTLCCLQGPTSERSLKWRHHLWLKLLLFQWAARLMLRLARITIKCRLLFILELAWRIILRAYGLPREWPRKGTRSELAPQILVTDK